MEYQGKLASSDAYMNLQLINCSEYINGTMAGYLGEVLIRCNNILYIRASEEQPEDDNNATAPAGQNFENEEGETNMQE